MEVYVLKCEIYTEGELEFDELFVYSSKDKAEKALQDYITDFDINSEPIIEVIRNNDSFIVKKIIFEDDAVINAYITKEIVH